MKCPACGAINLEDSRFCSKCGTPIHPSEEIFVSQTRTILKPIEELSPGTILADKYKIIEVIGRGGMGIVYKAEDLKLKRVVALKFLPPELMQDEEAKERFALEAQAAAALSHPNICTIHEIVEEKGKSFIVMEYIEGQSLSKTIKRSPFELDKALDVAIQIAEGLDEANKKSIIHRDIKSANIMVTDRGQAKIMDFGLAKVKGGTLLTREGTTLGTVAYMSPEQARGEEVDHRSDIWSLGIVLYEMLSGKLPFMGEHEASILYSVVHEEPKPLKSLRPDVPQEIQSIINRTLKKKPKSRYSSAADILKDLKQAQEDLRAVDKGNINLKSFLRAFRKPSIAVPTALITIVLCFVIVWFFRRGSKTKWAREQALPEIIQLVEEGKYIPAFQLAQQAEKYIQDDPLLTTLWPRMSQEVSIQTTPPDSDIYMKNYETVGNEWQYLGQSPIDSIRIPFGFFRWKIEKQEYQTLETSNSGSEGLLYFQLTKKEDIPTGMIRIPGGKISYLFIVNIGVMESVPLGSFWIDKYEVTNAQYKEFMEKGGYQKQEYWKQKFVKDNRVLSWEEAMEEFRDGTGRPGPSTWEIGTYPEGEDEYPVTGISWYEAAAYAEYDGKRLPTIYNWILAAGLDQGAYIIPLSNFGSSGPARVGEYQGISPFGCYDMAGNVREWCWNQSEQKCFALGGSWSDPHYMFNIPYAISPFDRSGSNGFRCMKAISPESIPEEMTEPLPHANIRDYSKEKPVSDEIFRVFKSLYSYDKTELNSVVESSDDSSPFWIKEKITYDAAYGNERIIAYLFLPKGGTPPYQTVVYFPGAQAVSLRSSKEIVMESIDFMIKSGRAVLYPIYKSTFERGDSYVHPPATITPWRNQMIFWYKDLARSIDYLESRRDIDRDKFAFFGSSLGAHVGVVLLALEKRIKASILYVGGFLLVKMTEEAPEIDQLNFAPRVTIPTLMLNGRYDYIFPLETSQVPMHRFLGTPEEHKVHKVYETAHFVPRNEKIKESLDWLDRYLGPVKR